MYLYYTYKLKQNNIDQRLLWKFHQIAAAMGSAIGLSTFIYLYMLFGTFTIPIRELFLFSALMEEVLIAIILCQRKTRQICRKHFFKIWSLQLVMLCYRWYFVMLCICATRAETILELKRPCIFSIQVPSRIDGTTQWLKPFESCKHRFMTKINKLRSIVIVILHVQWWQIGFADTC